MRPFLKWAGGKRQLLPYIKEFLNKVDFSKCNYFEPFVGAGSVFFALGHGRSSINDFNEEIINVYLVIRDNPYDLIKLLKQHKEKHSREYFYEIRALDRISEKYNKMTNIEKAARTIYLNKTCFNGLYRVNSNGFFNTPIGRYVNPLICDEENIMTVSNFLKNNKIKISCNDFEEAVKTCKKGDFIYFDPPYDYETIGFVNYVKEGFTRNDLVRLKKLCDKLISKGCHVLISNNDTSFVRTLFNSNQYEIIYETKTIKANRNISSKRNRVKVDEVLIYGKRR